MLWDSMKEVRVARSSGNRTAVGAEALVEYLSRLDSSLRDLGSYLSQVRAWGDHMAREMLSGRRLLVCGNGGSAAQAQHLTAELVGRYATERRPLSALALHTDSSTLTALINDYGPQQMFARQVRAHARKADILLAISTSGRSPNVLAAVAEGRNLGLTTYGLSGSRSSPLAEICDETICVEGPPAIAQDVHGVIIHLLCLTIDSVVASHSTGSTCTS